VTGLTRREWGGLVVGGLVASPWARLLADPRQKSIYAGVRLGAQSYSFRDRGLDAVIAAMADIGLSYCELWSNHVEHYAPSEPAPNGRPQESGASRCRSTTSATSDVSSTQPASS
jgi:hypothetical protein